MRRDQRLASTSDFDRVRREGRTWVHPMLVLSAAPGMSPAGLTRVGVTVGRKVGGAVERNRVRRRVRESVRAQYDRVVPGWDLVFVARSATGTATFQAIASVVTLLLSRAGLLRTEA